MSWWDKIQQCSRRAVFISRRLPTPASTPRLPALKPPAGSNLKSSPAQKESSINGGRRSAMGLDIAISNLILRGQESGKSRGWCTNGGGAM
jgi:hypothetical protein